MLYTRVSSNDIQFDRCLTISNRIPRQFLHLNFTQMDPKEKPGRNWSKISPPEQLEILRRYRDLNRSRKGIANERADDYYADSVLEYGLVQTVIDDASLNNRD